LSQELYPATTRSKNPKKTNAEYLQERSLNWDTIEHDGFHLPGTKEKKPTCGEWAWKGCNNIKGHEGKIFNDADCTNKGYVTNFQMCCFRADCEYCKLNWSYRLASKGTRRFERYQEVSKTKYEPSHIIISVPDWDYGKSKKELSQIAREKLKDIIVAGSFGGCIIFHPFRNKFIDGKLRWYYSPHFHVMGYGWLMPTDTEESREIRRGWIITKAVDKDKNGKPLKRSIFQTLSYILSHAGIKKRNHTLTWFGDLSYCKLEMEKEDYQQGKCPICENKLVRCEPKSEFYFKPPDEITEFIIDLDKWEFINNAEYYQQPGIKLPYSNSGGFEEEKPEKEKVKKERVKKPFRTLSLKYWMKNQNKII